VVPNDLEQVGGIHCNNQGRQCGEYAMSDDAAAENRPVPNELIRKILEPFACALSGRNMQRQTGVG
jgi:hypothetical protein